MPKRNSPDNVLTAGNEETTLGGRIFSAREKAGLSLHMTANLLGVKPSTMKSWENDRSEPRVNKLVALSGLVGVSPTYFLAEEGNAGVAVSAIRGRKDKLIDMLKEQVTELKEEQKVQAQRIRLMNKLLQKL